MINIFFFKYQYIIIIILTLILTVQHYKLIYKIIFNNSTKINNNKNKNNQRDTKKSDTKKLNSNILKNNIVMYISDKKNNHNINGYYELYINKLYNDAYVFKNNKLNIWIYKVYDIINNDKKFYWIITPINPNEYNKYMDNDKIIYYSSILKVSSYDNGLDQYIDYGLLPNGTFYDKKNSNEFIKVIVMNL